MNRFGKQETGFSLVEVMIGATVLVVVLTASMVAFHSIVRGSTSVQLHQYVNQSMNAVYERLRYDASIEFDTMDETADVLNDPTIFTYRNTPHFPRIQVRSTVGPIGATMQPDGTFTVIAGPPRRIRDIKIVAKWKEGDSTKSKEVRYTLAFNRKKEVGCILVFNFASATDSTHVPLDNVYVETKGLDNTTVNCTSEKGICEIWGAFIDPTGLTAYINGEEAHFGDDTGYYFIGGQDLGGGNIVAANTYVAMFHTPATRAGDTINFPPILMNPPGRVRIKVVDVGSSAPVTGTPAPKVYIIGHKDSLVVPRDFNISRDLDATGQAYVASLDPGYYSIYFGGSSDYCALAKIGDRDQNNSNPPPPPPGSAAGHNLINNCEYRLFDSGQEAQVLMKAPKRSDMSGNVKGWTWDSVGKTFVQSATMVNTPLVSFRNMSQGWHTESGRGVMDDFTNTFVWANVLSGNPNADVVNITNNRYLLPKEGPLIVNMARTDPNDFTSDYAYNFIPPNGYQWNYIYPRPYPAVNDPYTPVMVFGSPNSATPLIIVQGSVANFNKWIGLPRDPYTPLYPPDNSPTYGDADLIAGVASGVNTYDFGLLDKSCFVTLRGGIYAGPPAPAGTFFGKGIGLENGYVWVDWNTVAADTADGKVHGSGALFPDPGSRTNTMVENNKLNTDKTPDSAIPFTNTYANLLVLPNWGNDTTIVHYKGSSHSYSYPHFRGRVAAWKKIMDGSGNIKLILDPSLGFNISMAAYDTDSNEDLWGGLTTAALITNNPQYPAPDPDYNGQFIFSSKKVRTSTTYLGSSPTLTANRAFSQSPGYTNVDIVANSQGSLYNAVRLKVSDPVWAPKSGDKIFFTWNSGFANSDATVGAYVGDIKLYKIITTGYVYGYIHDKNGQPLGGVNVQLNLSWYTPAGSQVYTSPQTDGTTDFCGGAISGGPYQYCWNNMKFFGDEGYDVQIRVINAESVGYQSTGWYSWQGYDGIIVNKNFDLPVVPATGNRQGTFN